MNHDSQKIVMRGICRPDGAGSLVDARATKRPLLTELKVTLNWLKQYVDFDWSPEKLAKQITMLGLKVESLPAATEWRQIAPHSGSCGLSALSGISSEGAIEPPHAFTQFLSPLRGFNRFFDYPRFTPWATIYRCSAANH